MLYYGVFGGIAYLIRDWKHVSGVEVIGIVACNLIGIVCAIFAIRWIASAFRRPGAPDGQTIIRPAYQMSDPAPQPPHTLDYAPKPKRVGPVSRLLAQMSRPMPLGMYYVIMTAISVITLILAVLLRLVVRAFE